MTNPAWHGGHAIDEGVILVQTDSGGPDDLRSSRRIQKEGVLVYCERRERFSTLLSMLSETLYLCSDSGQLRMVEDVRSDLTLVLSLIEDIDDENLPKLLKPIRSHLDDILVPFCQVELIHAELLELMPEPIVDALVLAWHHDHLSYQSHGKKKHYHRRERDYWLTFSEGLLDAQYEESKALIFEKLNQVVKASSLVEMVNSLIRPYLNSSKGQITQETLNLIMFYHNHRRYKGGRRQGKAPIELLTGEALQGDWVDLLMQHREKASQEASLKSSLSLELVPYRDEHNDEKAPLCEPPIVQASEPQAHSAPVGTVMDAKAA